MEKNSKEGETPVFGEKIIGKWDSFKESDSLGMESKMGGKLLLKLNIYRRPIVNKYCEGKMKSTLKRESKDLKSLKSNE